MYSNLAAVFDRFRQNSIAVYSTLFSKPGAVVPVNDNVAPPHPDPGQNALVVPANDNSGELTRRDTGTRLAVVLAAGTVLAAASLTYLPKWHHASLPCLARQPVPRTQMTPRVGLITPDTPLAVLTKDQRNRLLDAMQRQEGWRPGTTSYEGHNPGNVNQGRWAKVHGSIGAYRGIAQFPNYEVGRQAMADLIFGVYGDRTIFGMLAGDPIRGIKGYAPAVKDQFGHMGNPRQYAENVAAWINESDAKQAPARRMSTIDCESVPDPTL
jgi:hypothetical protein